jgi:hypothetical protein
MRRTKFLLEFLRCPFRIPLEHRTSVVITWFLSVSTSTCWHSLWKIMRWLSFSTALPITYSLPCHPRQIVCLNYCRPHCANCKCGYRDCSIGQRAAVLYSHVLRKLVALIYIFVYYKRSWTWCLEDIKAASMWLHFIVKNRGVAQFSWGE